MPLPWLLAIAALPLLLQESSGPARIPAASELEEAWTAFANALPGLRESVAAEIASRIEATDDPGLKELLALRDRARKELAPRPARPRPFHDPATYGVRVRRAPVDPASADAAESRGSFKPWESAPPYHARVTWSLARDAAEDSGAPVEPLQQLENFLNGYPPDCDLLVAWVAKKFDFDPGLNAKLHHFDHVYCDLQGHAYPEITIYDAFASRTGMDMPDVDVIAYARLILGDRSYVSPIPPDARRQKLYDAIGDGFLECFRYRVWIEAAANLFVRPAAPLRDTHEGLRGRLLPLFAMEDGDVDRIAARLASFGTRAAFLEAIDEALARDPVVAAGGRRFERARAAQHWAVARAAYAVLRERGFLAR